MGSCWSSGCVWVDEVRCIMCGWMWVDEVHCMHWWCVWVDGVHHIVYRWMDEVHYIVCGWMDEVHCAHALVVRRYPDGSAYQGTWREGLKVGIHLSFSRGFFHTWFLS